MTHDAARSAIVAHMAIGVALARNELFDMAVAPFSVIIGYDIHRS
jgi:hypothetical protein